MVNTKNTGLEKLLREINDTYGVELTEENYEETILSELGEPKALSDYMKKYMNINREYTTLEWGCLFYLFVRGAEEYDVDIIEKYYRKLKKYPINYYSEITVAEMELRYYGDVFSARDGFLTALELKPKDAFVTYNLGLIYHLLGIEEKGAYYYRETVENADNSYQPDEYRARSLYNLGIYTYNIESNAREAVKLIKQAIKLMPDYPQARIALSQFRREV